MFDKALDRDKKNKYEICFLILHFLDEKMTIQCVDNLLKTFETDSIYILIVDNGSCNKSGDKLRDQYMNHDMIHVLINDVNLGFANGNNLGYRWIKQNLLCDFICVMNNDILFSQKNSIEIIISQYLKYEFFVLGPDIISKITGEHQNPLFEHGMTRKELVSYMRVMKLRKYLFLVYYTKNLIFSYFSEKLHIDLNDKLRIKKIETVLINPVLHGSCYFFSKKFIEKNEDLFDKNTFMFFEENILHYVCKKNNYLMIYCPDISVVHCEDVSTSAFLRNSYKREKWIINESLKSASYYIRMINEDVKKGINIVDNE